MLSQGILNNWYIPSLKEQEPEIAEISHGELNWMQVQIITKEDKPTGRLLLVWKYNLHLIYSFTLTNRQMDVIWGGGG